MSNPIIEDVAKSNPTFARKLADKLEMKRILIALSIFTAFLFTVEKIFSHNEIVMMVLHGIYDLSIAISASCMVLIFTVVALKFIVLDDNIDRLSKAVDDLPLEFANGTEVYLKSNGQELIKNTLFRPAMTSLRNPRDAEVERMRIFISALNKLGMREAHLSPAITYWLEDSLKNWKTVVDGISNLTSLSVMKGGDQIELAKRYLSDCNKSIEFVDYEILKPLATAWTPEFKKYVSDIFILDRNIKKIQTIICKCDEFKNASAYLIEQIEFMKKNGFDVKLVKESDLDAIDSDFLKWRSEIFDAKNVLRV
jgi:hypothetical protein